MALNSDTQSQIHAISSYRLDSQKFITRFHEILTTEDPYAREYSICSDSTIPNKRVAVRRYIADDESKCQDVFQNMESYLQLGSVEGMCSLEAFYLDTNGGEVHAAFQYNDQSLTEVLNKGISAEKKDEFYLSLIKNLLEVLSSAGKLGIEIEDIIPENILMQTDSEKGLKILYDERQKQYDKIQQGLKVFVSPEKMTHFLQHGEDLQPLKSGEEAIFQIGLLMLDVMYQCQKRHKEQIFSKDQPLSRTRINQGYLIFNGDSDPELNVLLIDQKVKFLLGSSILIDSFLQLIERMIAQRAERISLDDLTQEINKLKTQSIKIKAAQLEKQQIQVPQKDVYKKLVQVIQRKQSYVVPEQANQEMRQLYKQNGDNKQFKRDDIKIKQQIISLSTVDTAKKSQEEAFNYEKPSQLLSNIPNPKSLPQMFKHPVLISKLQNFIQSLSSLSIIIKDYPDRSCYNGQVDSLSQRRNGQGIFVSQQGDLYYGSWKENLLIDGTYLFRNGQGFQGTVHRGKQGYGTYYYANGNIYSGEWKNDVKNGQGIMKYPNGDSYEGNWSGGKKNGKGIYLYSNNNTYQGNFVDGRKEGFGVVTFPNGTKVEAYWQKTHVQGPGKVFYQNGDYYEGQYHRSQKQGEGLYIWSEAQYRGGFQKDTLEGLAKVKFSEDQFYEGMIQNGKRSGKGRYRYANGDQFEGQWKNDEKLLGVYKFSEGDYFNGNFKRGSISRGTMSYSNGESYEGQFMNGQRQGTGVYRGADGEVLFNGLWEHDQFLSSF